MGMSISLKKDAKKTSIRHNNRKMSKEEEKKNGHIDFSRSDQNNYLVSKSLKELYRTEFGQAQKDYNDKQKRADRKIENYYDHIQKGKKTSLQQEMILQVGDKDDFSNNPENQKIASDVLQEWFQKFEERNPNLKVYNAVIHNDEASPHMHLNFVPVATGYKRGMDKQVSYDKALLQQDNSLNKERPFDEWRNKEVQLLEKMLKERGIERDLVGTNNYRDVRTFKKEKDELRELEQETLAVKQEFGEVRQKLKETKNELDLKEMKVAFLDQSIVETEEKLGSRREKLQEDVQGLLKAVETSKAVESIQVENGGLFDRKNVKMSIEDFENLKGLAMASEGLKMQNKTLKRELGDSQAEKKPLENKNQQLEGSNQELKKENTQLKLENQNLEEKVTGLQRNIAYLQETFEIIKRNSQQFLGIAKEKIHEYVGTARAVSLKMEYGAKIAPKDLLMAVPENEKAGANKYFEQIREKAEKEKEETEKDKPIESKKKRKEPEHER